MQPHQFELTGPDFEDVEERRNRDSQEPDATAVIVTASTVPPTWTVEGKLVRETLTADHPAAADLPIVHGVWDTYDRPAAMNWERYWVDIDVVRGDIGPLGGVEAICEQTKMKAWWVDGRMRSSFWLHDAISRREDAFLVPNRMGTVDVVPVGSTISLAELSAIRNSARSLVQASNVVIDHRRITESIESLRRHLENCVAADEWMAENGWELYRDQLGDNRGRPRKRLLDLRRTYEPSMSPQENPQVWMRPDPCRENI